MPEFEIHLRREVVQTATIRVKRDSFPDIGFPLYNADVEAHFPEVKKGIKFTEADTTPPEVFRIHQI